MTRSTAAIRASSTARIDNSAGDYRARLQGQLEAGDGLSAGHIDCTILEWTGQWRAKLAFCACGCPNDSGLADTALLADANLYNVFNSDFVSSIQGFCRRISTSPPPDGTLP